MIIARFIKCPPQFTPVGEMNRCAPVVRASDTSFVPCRRAPEQPVLSFSAEAAAVVPHAVQQLLTDGMQQLQQLGAGGSFGLELGVMPPELHRGVFSC